jgi:phage shock protein A
MGLFSRFKTFVSATINDLIGKAEKPEKMLNQAIIDMNEQLVDAKKSVAMAIADEKKLKRELDNQSDQAVEWERKAELAIRAGKDDLAKEALLRKAEYDKYAAEYEKQWALQRTSVEKLKGSLLDLQTKIDDANRKKNLLIARAKRAEAQQKIQSTMANISDTKNGFDTFDRMAKKVDELEARADATEELAGLSVDSSLEKKFAELEQGDQSGDALLLAFKQKLAALPPGRETSNQG